MIVCFNVSEIIIHVHVCTFIHIILRVFGLIVVHRQRLVSADFLIFMIRAINCVVSYLTFTARSVEFPLHVIIAMQNFTQVSKT